MTTLVPRSSRVERIGPHPSKIPPGGGTAGESEKIMKETRWTDGWHETSWGKYLVENGRFKWGVENGKTVYPYTESKYGGYDNRSGELEASKRNFEKITWL